MRATIALLSTLLLGSSVHAQDDTLALSADEAVARALEVSPRLRELRASESAAEAAIEQAEAGSKPQVDVSASYTRYSDIPEIPLPAPDGGEGILFPNLPDNYRAWIGASLPLYTGGRVAGLVDAARGEELSASASVAAGRRDLALEVRRAYWRLVTARETARVLDENLEAFEAHIADAENRVRFGLAARNEVLAVEVERDRAELARRRAETAALVAAADLRRLLGLEPGVDVAPTDALEPVDLAVDDVEVLVALAHESRAELEALEARVAAARARARVEKSARMPQVSASAGYLYASPNPRFLPPREEWNDNWELGVSVGMNVFDGGRAAAAEARELAQAEALEARLQDLRERIRLEVLSSVLEIENADRAVELAETAVRSARENVRVAAERYREGVLLSSELLDAEVALRRARLELTEALASQRLARAALDRAIGR